MNDNDIETKVMVITEKMGLWFLAKQVLEDNDFHSTGKKQHKLLSWLKENNIRKFGEDDYIFIGSEILIPKNEYSVACIIGNDISSGHVEQETFVDTVNSLELWIDNGDGTYTAKEGATLWGLYGNDWENYALYAGDPAKLQIDETVGKLVGGASTITEKALANAEKNLQMYAIQNALLKDLINTEKLAEIIVQNVQTVIPNPSGEFQNISVFDQETKNYILSQGSSDSERIQAIKSLLNNVTVYHGIDQEKGDAEYNRLGANDRYSAQDPFFDGLCTGNKIFIKKHLPTTPNPIDADLIGHEAIHAIQAEAVGKLNFVKYNATAPYTENNRYELAAYAFGGGIDWNRFPSFAGYSQILKGSGNWWLP
jgi:hypothetical protein